MTPFFVGLGLEVENRMFVEGEFLDTVIGIPGARTEIVMLQPPDVGTRLELSSFARPDHLPGSPAAPPTSWDPEGIIVSLTERGGLEAGQSRSARSQG